MEKKKKAQHSAGFKPTTSRVVLRRRALYRCATTAAILIMIKLCVLETLKVHSMETNSLKWTKLEEL